jgi:hypothetical protein
LADTIKDLKVDSIIIVANNKSNNIRLTNQINLRTSINNTHNNKIVPVKTNKMLPRINSSGILAKEKDNLHSSSTDLPLLSSTQINRSNRNNLIRQLLDNNSLAHNNLTQLLEETTSSNNSTSLSLQ